MANRKKIIFLVTKSNWGGAQRYVFDLATNLNHEYKCLVAAGGNGPLLERLREFGVQTVSIPSLLRDIRAFSDIGALRELYILFKKERPDIVHLNSSKAGLLGAIAARIAGVKRIIFTVHGWPFNEPISPVAKLFRWYASLATLLLCHTSISVSHFDAVHAPFGYPLLTIHNGIAEPHFLSREEAREKLLQNIAASGITSIIGTVAELHKNKGVDLLLDAMPHVPNTTLLVIGEGEERPALEQQIKRLGLTSRVHLLGFIPDAASLLKAFDIFVLPSRTEALGYVLLEAGFAEVPVVASTVGGIPEIIEDGLTGVLVPAYDAQALAEALQTLTVSPGTRGHYTERLKEKVEIHFELQGMIKKTTAVYENVT